MGGVGGNFFVFVCLFRLHFIAAVAGQSSVWPPPLVSSPPLSPLLVHYGHRGRGVPAPLPVDGSLKGALFHINSLGEQQFLTTIHPHPSSYVCGLDNDEPTNIDPGRINRN